MRFKIDKNLEILAALMGEAPEVTSKGLCQKMIDCGLLENKEIEWGEPVMHSIGPCYISTLLWRIAEYMFRNVPEKSKRAILPKILLETFCQLIPIGDGDCPECGGELFLKDKEGYEIEDGNEYTPNTFVVTKYIYECRNCGERIESEKEL